MERPHTAAAVVELPERPREIHRRRALIFLDRDDPGAGRRLAAALSARGYATRTVLQDFTPDALRDGLDGELLVVRLPSETRPELAAFVPLLDERDTAAVVMIADFGWIATADPADPEALTSKLSVRGDPQVDAALLTTSLAVGEHRPSRSGPTLTELVTRVLNTEDGPILVGALRDAVDAELRSTTRRCYLSVHRMGHEIRLADARSAGHGNVSLGHGNVSLGEAQAELTRRGTPSPPDPLQVVTLLHDAYLSEPAGSLLRRLSLLQADEMADAEVARLLGASEGLGELVAPWALVDASGRVTHPAVREFGIVRLTPEEAETYEPLLREWRASRRPVRPRARLTPDRWTIEDQLGHQVYAEAVAAFLRHPETRPPLTIGIKGPWGTGKTSLMRMIQNLLDPGVESFGAQGTVTNAEVLERVRDLGEPPARVEEGSRGWRPTVWFNPWMYQSGEQVWAGLAHEIITQVTARLPVVERERFWLRLNLARIDREAVRRRVYRTILTRLTPLVVGLVAVAAMTTMSFTWPFVREVAGGIGSAGALAVLGAAGVRVARFLREPAEVAFGALVRPPDLLVPDAGYGGKTGFLHLVQTDMRHVLDLVASEDRPLVVFVDDLDRCSSGTVAQVIEAINLFLAGEFPDCVFILAMEPDVVAAHVEVAYRGLALSMPADPGAPSLGWRFLEKIVQLPLSVPRLDDAAPAYLRSLLEIPAEAPERRATQADPASSLEQEIRRRSPTITSLDRVARQLHEELTGLTGRPGQPLSAEIRQAAERVYDDLYTDRKAYDALSELLPALPQPNPREIKRYVNVFRFYSFVTFSRTLAGAPPATDQEVAKLALLTTRWPHLLSTLTRDHDGRPLLTHLEEAARKEVTIATSTPANPTPETPGTPGTPGDMTPLEALRPLLRTDPPIAALAAELL